MPDVSGELRWVESRGETYVSVVDLIELFLTAADEGVERPRLRDFAQRLSTFIHASGEYGPR